MNRRDFLSRFAQTAAGALVVHMLDVDKLLWVAGERTIFLPAVVAAEYQIVYAGTLLAWRDDGVLVPASIHSLNGALAGVALERGFAHNVDYMSHGSCRVLISAP